MLLVEGTADGNNSLSGSNTVGSSDNNITGITNNNNTQPITSNTKGSKSTNHTNSSNNSGTATSTTTTTPAKKHRSKSNTSSSVTAVPTPANHSIAPSTPISRQPTAPPPPATQSTPILTTPQLNKTNKNTPAINKSLSTTKQALIDVSSDFDHFVNSVTKLLPKTPAAITQTNNIPDLAALNTFNTPITYNKSGGEKKKKKDKHKDRHKLVDE